MVFVRFCLHDTDKQYFASSEGFTLVLINPFYAQCFKNRTPNLAVNDKLIWALTG